MNRADQILQGIDKSMKGLEVAPWFNPLAPKAQGYNIQTLDVFDNVELMKRAKSDPGISPDTYGKLESVDYVGSATEIATLVDRDDYGTFDYVISSHNFEHLPNPIKFLQGCATILKPGGKLIMALPDGRACFDYFRPHSETVDWLEAFLEDRKQPIARQVFAFNASMAKSAQGSVRERSSIVDTTPARQIVARQTLAGLWSEWKSGAADVEYRDTHCSVFTPASLRLLIEDCRTLGLTGFQIVDISPTAGVEFIVHLKLTGLDAVVRDEAEVLARRSALMHAIWADHAMRYSPSGKRSVAYGEALRTRNPVKVFVVWLRQLNQRRRAVRRYRRAQGKEL